MDPPAPDPTPSYLRPYRTMVDRHGPGFESLLWNSQATQEARFLAAAEMIDLRGRTVIDAGSGRGDFLAFLIHSGVEYGRFIGLEAIPELAAVGGELDHENAEFRVVDFAEDPRAFTVLPDPEVIFFSGSLNTFEPVRALAVLDRAWSACREALVFNFLSDQPSRRFRVKETGPARRFNTLAMVAWSLERTPLVLFRQDYLDGNDATIVMRKPGRS